MAVGPALEPMRDLREPDVGNAEEVGLACPFLGVLREATAGGIVAIDPVSVPPQQVSDGVPAVPRLHDDYRMVLF